MGLGPNFHEPGPQLAENIIRAKIKIEIIGLHHVLSLKFEVQTTKHTLTNTHIYLQSTCKKIKVGVQL